MFLLERIECNTYNVLDSASRNEKYREESFCDDLYYPFDSEWNALSPQWRGSSWYRFLPPAGTKLSQTPQEEVTVQLILQDGLILHYL